MIAPASSECPCDPPGESGKQPEHALTTSAPGFGGRGISFRRERLGRAPLSQAEGQASSDRPVYSRHRCTLTDAAPTWPPRQGRGISPRQDAQDGRHGPHGQTDGGNDVRNPLIDPTARERPH